MTVKMIFKQSCLAILVLCIISTGAISAQGSGEGTIVEVLQVQVKPSNAAKYEAAVKELFALNAEYGTSTPIQAAVSDESVYGFLSIVGDAAGIKRSEDESAAMQKKGGKKFQAIRNRVNDASEHTTSWDVVIRPDLSYTPANPRLSPEEATTTHYIFYYLERGAEADAEANAKAAIKLYTEKKISTGFTVSFASTGADLPLITVAITAKSIADFYAENEKIQAALGAEGQKLNANIAERIRRIEHYNYTSLPDLSYQPGTD